MALFSIPQLVLKTQDHLFAHCRQALCVVVGNDGRIVSDVAYFQPHNAPGVTVHTSVYGKVIRLQLVVPICVPWVVRSWAVKWPMDDHTFAPPLQSQMYCPWFLPSHRYQRYRGRWNLFCVLGDSWRNFCCTSFFLACWKASILVWSTSFHLGSVYWSRLHFLRVVPSSREHSCCCAWQNQQSWQDVERGWSNQQEP